MTKLHFLNTFVLKDLGTNSVLIDFFSKVLKIFGFSATDYAVTAVDRRSRGSKERDAVISDEIA